MVSTLRVDDELQVNLRLAIQQVRSPSGIELIPARQARHLRRLLPADVEIEDNPATDLLGD